MKMKNNLAAYTYKHELMAELGLRAEVFKDDVLELFEKVSAGNCTIQEKKEAERIYAKHREDVSIIDDKVTAYLFQASNSNGAIELMIH